MRKYTVFYFIKSYLFTLWQPPHWFVLLGIKNALDKFVTQENHSAGSNIMDRKKCKKRRNFGIGKDLQFNLGLLEWPK